MAGLQSGNKNLIIYCRKDGYLVVFILKAKFNGKIAMDSAYEYLHVKYERVKYSIPTLN